MSRRLLLVIIGMYAVVLSTRQFSYTKRPGCRITGYVSGTVLMNCSHGILTSPPPPPARCRRSLQLDLSSNFISHLDDTSFHHYSHCPVVVLSLRNNTMTRISAGAFEPLKSLTTLDMSENVIAASVLRGALAALPPLSVLDLSSMGLEHIAGDFFQELSGAPLLSLIFRNNTNNHFPLDALVNLKGLGSLDFGSNHLTVVNLKNAFFPNMTRIVFDNNHFDEFPDFCEGNNTSSNRFPMLKIVKVQWNFMRSLEPAHFNCLSTLTRFYLNGNVFCLLATNQFALLPSLFKITLSYVGCSSQIIQRAVFNNTSLKQIFFRVNHIWFREAEIDLRMFEGCTTLQLLNLNDNVFHVTNEYEFEILFGKLTSLQVLVMGGDGLRFIPRVISERLTLLESLSLYRNSITDWQEGTFNNLTKLKKLFMTGNKISSVTDTSFPESFVETATDIDISGNPFDCTCELMWFVKWMKESKSQFVDAKTDYECATPLRYKQLDLAAVPLSEANCLLDLGEKITTLTCGSLMVVFIVVGTILYRYRWDFLFLVYLMRYSNIHETDTRHYEYDAFVAYSVDDRSWVIDTLLPVIEEKEDFKLCIHDRDFPIGKLILDNIVDSINKSRKLIIVLSNSFAQSCWCQFELNLIQRHVLETGQRLLVVVLLEEIDSSHVTNALRVMLNTTTYLTWGEESHIQKSFFSRLRLILQKPRNGKRRISV